MSITLPNIGYLDELEPISGGPEIINANFAELSSHATAVSAGLVALASIGDLLSLPADIQKVVTASVMNQRLSATFDLLPAISETYDLGSADLLYNFLNAKQLNLSGSVITVSGGILFIDGIPINNPGGAEVGPHALESLSAHTNILGAPTADGQTFIRSGSNWYFGYPGNINPNNTPLNGDLLIWDSGSNTWKNQSAAFIDPSGTVDFVADQSMGNKKLTGLNSDLNSYTDYDAIPKKFVTDILAAAAVTPPGTVQMSFTNNMPGYLPCNGDTYLTATYPDLFNAIGYTYTAAGSANISGTGFFSVPDTRGLFFRSYDDGAGIDPDAATRNARPDGVSGDNVGTIQDDEFASHSHGNAFQDGSSFNIQTDSDLFHTNAALASTGGNETRPKNIYVEAFIKT